MKCLLDDETKCVITTSIAVVNGEEQVQETCATCGNGCGYMRVKPIPVVAESDEVTNG